MKYVGYHRVSTMEQRLDRGEFEIQKFCQERKIPLYKDKVYVDRSTGKNFQRPSYIIVKQELLEPGDALIVTELDRLGRNKTNTLEEIKDFQSRNIRVMVLEIPTSLMDFGNMDNNLSKMMLETVNNMMFEMFATFAQAEMEKREKRQREGIEAMKERGEWAKYGRPAAMNFKDFCRQYQRVLSGEIRPFELKKELGLTTTTFYRYKANYEREFKGKD